MPAKISFLQPTNGPEHPAHHGRKGSTTSQTAPGFPRELTPYPPPQSAGATTSHSLDMSAAPLDRVFARIDLVGRRRTAGTAASSLASTSTRARMANAFKRMLQRFRGRKGGKRRGGDGESVDGDSVQRVMTAPARIDNGGNNTPAIVVAGGSGSAPAPAQAAPEER